MPPELVRRVLDRATDDTVLVGGQALAWWMAFYDVQPIDLRLPAISRDVDFFTVNAANRAPLARFAEAIEGGRTRKGNVLTIAEVAGITGAKRTADLIPLCHPIPLTSVAVEIAPDGAGLLVTAMAETTAQTGVEMEALTAASVAALTLYDMAKAVDRSMRITQVQLEQKSGGKSGDFQR